MARAVRAYFTTYTIEVGVISDEKLFLPGGNVYDWSHKLAEQLETVTRQTAPPTVSKSRWKHVGTGRLKRGITATVNMDVDKVITIDVNSSAPYSMFVHGGTAIGRGSHIYSTLGWANRITVDSLFDAGTTKFRPPAALQGLYMALPPNTGGHFPWHLRVRGQRANPFLSRGYNRVARMGHPALKKLSRPDLLPVDAPVVGE